MSRRDSNREAIQGFIRSLAADGRLSTALCEAARWGELDLVKQLLETSAAVNSAAENGGTALGHAASAGEVKIVRYLLQNGADPNAANVNDGTTPLMRCFLAMHPDKVYLQVASLLRDAGADFTLQDNQGRTVHDLARLRNRPQVDEWFRSLDA